MFLKSSTSSSTGGNSSKKERETIPSVITRDMSMLGNIISDGNIDFEGTLDGNIRCNTLTLRSGGTVKGEVMANTVHVYGKVNGLIKAKNVQLYASCNVEGIIMHETISIEDGAFVDGKFKRTDKVSTEGDADFKVFDEETSSSTNGGGGSSPMLENIRLIR